MSKFTKREMPHVSSDEKMTPYMESWLAEVEKDIKTGKNMSGPFYSIEELIKHLEK